MEAMEAMEAMGEREGLASVALTFSRCHRLTAAQQLNSP
jgi:hypothetical protein